MQSVGFDRSSATSLTFGGIGALRLRAMVRRARSLAGQVPDEDKPWT